MSDISVEEDLKAEFAMADFIKNANHQASVHPLGHLGRWCSHAIPDLGKVSTRFLAHWVRDSASREHPTPGLLFYGLLFRILMPSRTGCWPQNELVCVSGAKHFPPHGDQSCASLQSQLPVLWSGSVMKRLLAADGPALAAEIANLSKPSFEGLREIPDVRRELNQ